MQNKFISSNKEYSPPSLEEIWDNRKEKPLPCWVSSIKSLVEFPYYPTYMYFYNGQKQCQICNNFCGRTIEDCSNYFLSIDTSKLNALEKCKHSIILEDIKMMYEIEIENIDEIIEKKQEVLDIKKRYDEKKKRLQDL